MRDTAKKYSVLSTNEKTAFITAWLLEKKAEDIVALDLSASHSFTDALVIVSASSIRHAQGLADFVLKQCRDANFEFLRMEGYTGGQWILMDFNDVVISLFQRETRDLYRMEELWKNAPALHDARGPAN